MWWSVSITSAGRNNTMGRIFSIGLASTALGVPSPISPNDLTTKRVNARGNLKRELSHPSCAICSYGLNNVEHKIYAVAYMATGQLIQSVEEFAQHVGHGFIGHRLCCDFDEPQDTHNITSHLGHVRTIRKTKTKPVLQKPIDTSLAGQKLKRAATNESLTDFIQQPPVCVPLMSANPLFNPYSELLTPADSATRALLAFPLYTSHTFGPCPKADVANGACDVSVQDTVTITSSLSYSVSDGSTNSYTNSIGSTTTVGSSTEAMQSISDTLEKSNTFTHTDTQGGSQSSTWSQALTKTSESQTNWQKTHGTDTQDSQNVGQDVSRQQSHSKEQGTSSSDEIGWNAKTSGSATVSAEENFGVFKGTESATISAEVGAQGSHTDGHQQSLTDTSSSGVSNSINFGRQMGSSDSSTQGGSHSDSISDSVTNSLTNEKNWQSSDSYASGNSQSHTVGSSNTYGTSKSLSNELQKTFSTARSIDTTHGGSFENSTSQTTSFIAHIAAGVTVRLAYLTAAKFTQIPWICKQNGKNAVMTTDMADISKSLNSSTSLAFLASDEELDYYTVDDHYYTTATNTNTLRSNETFIVNQESASGTEVTGGKRVVMSTSGYELVLSGFGTMYVKNKADGKQGSILWSTHTTVQRVTDELVNGIKYNKGTSRLLINDLGHILIQVDNMFTKVGVTPYNNTYFNEEEGGMVTDTFTTIWSNVPKHLMVPIGMRRGGYTLVLEEFATTPLSWNLILYDGGGSKVWCANSNRCNWAGSNGYRFPRNYLLPTDFPTDAIDPTTDGPSYPHNYINPAYTFTTANPSIHVSENQKCGPILKSGQGLTSPNKRFKLILDFSGNLIFKDGVRTMWETFTANVGYAQPPYTLSLSNRGSLYVTDKWGGLIVNSILDNSIIRNSSIAITDQGELQVFGTDGRQIWTSFDLINPGMSGWRGWTGRKTYCYAGCSTCLPKQPPTINQLYSNGSDFTPWTAYLKAGQSLAPATGNLSLSVSNTSVSLGNCTLFQNNRSNVVLGMMLAISGTGRLSYIDANASTAAWQVGTFYTGVEPFSLAVENGTMTIRDVTGNVTYTQACLSCVVPNGFAANTNVTGCPFMAPSLSVPKLTYPVYMAAKQDLTFTLEEDGLGGTAQPYVYHFSGSNDFVPSYLSDGSFTLSRPDTDDCLAVDLTSNIVVKVYCTTKPGSGTVWWNYISPSGDVFYVNADATQKKGPIGMCLTAPLLKNQAQATVEPCNVSHDNQKWINKNPQVSYSPLYQMGSGKCMTVVNGNQIQLNSCTLPSPTPQQLWAYGYTSYDGTFRPKFDSTLCLDFSGDLANDSPLILNPCNGADRQSWIFDALWMTYTNKANSGFAINNAGASSNDGNKIQIYRPDKTIAASWQYGGTYVPINVNGWSNILDSVNKNLAIQVVDTYLKLQPLNAGVIEQQFINDNGLLRWRFNLALCIHTGTSDPSGHTVFLDICYNPNGQPKSTKWTISNNQIKAVKTNQCLNDKGGLHNNGDEIVASDCVSASGNSWTVTTATH
ncbi:hypothetical protein HDU76_012498 [Blyttiomyces sp. JEL0837]|nr:hypothetical protein HDU76_012498 [Blyttiomyces sp. JEL0837]